MSKNKLSCLINKKNIRVAISPFCNLNCIYCDGQKSRTLDKPGAMEDFRRKPLNKGIIGTDVFIKIIKMLHLAGFEGVTLTGGEPLLNPEWDVIVNEIRKIGISRIEMTTNGMLLNAYLQKKGRMPKGLTLLKVSLDTFIPERFKILTGNGKLKQVMEGIKAVKLNRPELKVRANKVLLRSDIGYLLNYIEFCENSCIDEINLLDLILIDPCDPQKKVFFEKEFISISEVIELLYKQRRHNFLLNDNRYGIEIKLPSNLRIILKDSNGLTLRNDQCLNCPIYCQEGLFTVRIATDGAITTCLDYKAQLPFINAVSELKNGTLPDRANELMQTLREAKPMYAFADFFHRHKIKIRDSANK